MRSDSIAIAVFARAPVPGATKTRLIPRLGPEGAAELHRRLVEQTLQTALAAATGPVTLFCAPDAESTFFASCRERYGVALQPQADGDLGARMLAAFMALAPSPVLLIGTDLPVLTPRLLKMAAQVLRDGHAAVFLPTEDGGYGLIGLREPEPALFGTMAWSTPSVMDETRRRLRAAGLRWSEPAVIWDLDRPEDVDRLLAEGLLPGWQPDEAAG